MTKFRVLLLVLSLMNTSAFSQNSARPGPPQSYQNYIATGLASTGLIISRLGIVENLERHSRGFYSSTEYARLVSKLTPKDLAHILYLTEHADIRPLLLKVTELESQLLEARSQPNHSHQSEVLKRRLIADQILETKHKIEKQTALLERMDPKRFSEDRMIVRIIESKKDLDAAKQHYTATALAARAHRYEMGFNPHPTEVEIALKDLQEKEAIFNRKTHDFALRTYHKLLKNPDLRAEIIVQNWNRSVMTRYGAHGFLALFSAGVLVYQLFEFKKQAPRAVNEF